MSAFRRIGVTILRLLLLCVMFWVTSCSPTETSTTVRVIGYLSSNDLAQIKRVTSEELAKQSHSLKGGPLKSIEVTTNNLYERHRLILSTLAAQAATNPAAEVRLYEMEKIIRPEVDEKTNMVVEVWYVDTNARWGEAGYFVEKGTNGWKITGELFR